MGLNWWGYVADRYLSFGFFFINFKRSLGVDWYPFSGNLNDWELGIMVLFLAIIQGHSVKRVQEDGLFRREMSKGFFHWRVLFGHWWSYPIPSKILWKWAFSCGRHVEVALRLNHLQKRGCSLANKCVLCKELESIDHILLHCNEVQLL